MSKHITCFFSIDMKHFKYVVNVCVEMELMCINEQHHYYSKMKMINSWESWNICSIKVSLRKKHVYQVPFIKVIGKTVSISNEVSVPEISDRNRSLQFFSASPIPICWHRIRWKELMRAVPQVHDCVQPITIYRCDCISRIE